MMRADEKNAWKQEENIVKKQKKNLVLRKNKKKKRKEAVRACLVLRKTIF